MYSHVDKKQRHAPSGYWNGMHLQKKRQFAVPREKRMKKQSLLPKKRYEIDLTQADSLEPSSSESVSPVPTGLRRSNRLVGIDRQPGKPYVRSIRRYRRVPRRKITVNNGQVDVTSRHRRRFKPGTVALREIRKYQQSSNLLIRCALSSKLFFHISWLVLHSKAPFQRVVRELGAEFKNDLKFQAPALLAFQEATEAYMVELFHNAQLVALGGGRVTVMLSDMEVAREIRGDKPYWL